MTLLPLRRGGEGEAEAYLLLVDPKCEPRAGDEVMEAKLIEKE